MSNQQHTPGPWSIFMGSFQIGSGNKHIATAHYAGSPAVEVDEAMANARLITAAPELLCELIEQDKFLGVLAGTVPLSEKDTHRRIAMHRESVRAAIAKGKG